MNQLTIKSQEAIQQAQQVAADLQHQAIDTAHLLKGILLVDENITPFLIKKSAANLSTIEQGLDKILSALPKVSGEGSPYLTREVNGVLQKANTLMKEVGDDYVSLELLLIALVLTKDNVGQLLRDQGLNKKDLLLAIQDLRQGLESDKS